MNATIFEGLYEAVAAVTEAVRNITTELGMPIYRVELSFSVAVDKKLVFAFAI